MIKSTVEKMANPIGFEIGTSDDIIQSDLLNGFCKGLHDSIPNKNNFQSQLCAISNKLDKTAENVLIELVEFIKCKRSE